MTQKALIKTVILFAALAISGIALLGFGETSPIPTIQRSLPLLGSALFTSALTYFLITIADFRREERR